MLLGVDVVDAMIVWAHDAPVGTAKHNRLEFTLSMEEYDV